MAAWKPRPVPTSSTRSPPTSCSACSMVAIRLGCVVTCPWGMGIGVSRYARPAADGGTNRARGMARNAAMTLWSRMPWASSARTRSSGDPGRSVVPGPLMGFLAGQAVWTGWPGQPTTAIHRENPAASAWLLRLLPVGGEEHLYCRVRDAVELIGGRECVRSGEHDLVHWLVHDE